MDRLLICMTLLAAVDVTLSNPCATMNVRGLKKFAKTACITSCSVQQGMNRFLTGLALLALVDVASQVYLTTCARMDVPLLKGAANTACVAACAIKVDDFKRFLL
ncbi:hypothetical protein ANCCEY_09324 [Ancylostoma ceylanicum]|uniref:Uncharacterized protein n=1 Tax=Ancylostoma ceylanicum TaxID=53326 RepID=A0A0D6LHQ3_9BILA|nr:hypothetical protein ANCCEY_09324 [Ancylostoma ceylanicum]